MILFDSCILKRQINYRGDEKVHHIATHGCIERSFFKATLSILSLVTIDKGLQALYIVSQAYIILGFQSIVVVVFHHQKRTRK